MEINVSDEVIKEMIREEVSKKVNSVVKEEKIDKVLKAVITEKLRALKFGCHHADWNERVAQIAKELQTKELHSEVVERVSDDIARVIAEHFTY